MTVSAFFFHFFFIDVTVCNFSRLIGAMNRLTLLSLLFVSALHNIQMPQLYKRTALNQESFSNLSLQMAFQSFRNFVIILSSSFALRSPVSTVSKEICIVIL